MSNSASTLRTWCVTTTDGGTQTVTNCEYTIDATGAVVFDTVPPLRYPNGTWKRVDPLHTVEAPAATEPVTTEPAPKRERPEKSERE